MACNQQQYNCFCRTNKENLEQKYLLWGKNCGSTTPEVYNPWWNSPEPYFPLAFSNEDTHPSLTSLESRQGATAPGMNRACTITLTSLQNYRGGHVVIWTHWERQPTGESQKFPSPQLNSDSIVKWMLTIKKFQKFIMFGGLIDLGLSGCLLLEVLAGWFARFAFTFPPESLSLVISVIDFFVKLFEYIFIEFLLVWF